jgi:hypothetical protein
MRNDTLKEREKGKEPRLPTLHLHEMMDTLVHLLGGTCARSVPALLVRGQHNNALDDRDESGPVIMYSCARAQGADGRAASSGGMTRARMVTRAVVQVK